jgi:uncharacterized protein involved in exopolysaccharide biosynthesis
VNDAASATLPRRVAYTGGGPGDLLALLSRRKLIWVPIFVVVTAISVHSYVRSPVIFSSSTKVLVSRGERESSLNPRVRVLDWREELGSEVETVYSQQVIKEAEAILLEEGVRDRDGEPLKLDPSQVGAEPIESSSVLRISYRSPLKDHAQLGVSAITQAYMNYRKEIKELPEIESYLLDRLQGVEQNLEAKGQERKELLREAGTASFADQRTELFSLGGVIKRSLVNAREQIAYVRERLQALRDFRGSGLSDVAYIPVFADDDERRDIGMRSLVEGLVALQSRENELASRYTENHPQVIEIRNQIEGHKVLIAEAADRYESSLRAELRTWRARERQLAEELETIDRELADFPEREYRLNRVNLELETLENDYRRLVTEYTAAGVQNASLPNWQVRLYAEASKPTRIQTGDVVRTVVVSLFSLVVALGIAFIVDGLDPSVKTVRETEVIFDAPVLALVAKARRK